MLLAILLILAVLMIAGGVFVHPWIFALLLILAIVAFADRRAL
jgi:hypothetical protein